MAHKGRSSAFGDRSTIEWLQWPGGVLIVLRVLGNLRLRKLHRVLHHVPGDFLVTNRSRQRTRESVKGAIHRQEVGGINLYSRDFAFLPGAGTCSSKVFMAGLSFPATTGISMIKNLDSIERCTS